MLDLYILETCPYCRKVMSFLSENNIKFHKFEVSNKDNIQKLLVLGGKEQVPFLFDEDSNIKMYESDDIIEYLKSLKQV